MNTRMLPLVCGLLAWGLVGGLFGAEAEPKVITQSDGISQEQAELIAEMAKPHYCYNPPYEPDPNPNPETPCPDGCCTTSATKTPDDGMWNYCNPTDSPGSRIDNINYSHHHYGYDYQVDLPTACRSCSGSTAEPLRNNDLPRYRILRVHRFRDVAYPSSFGPGIFQMYDLSLQLYTTTTGERFIDLFDPIRGSATRFFDGPWSYNQFSYADPADGVYKDLIRNHFASLRLFDAQGVLTQSHDQAVAAVVEDHVGGQMLFQIIDLGGGTRAGRLLRIQDSRGNPIALTYAFQPGDDLGGSPDKLWQLATITDGYGHVARYHYAAEQVSGRWVVEAIDLPNDLRLSYGYADGHLASVQHPDGTQSAFTYTWNERSKCTVLGYDDAAADGTHRRKQVYVTTNFTTGTHKQGVFLPTSAQLVRLVVDAEGQVSYLNIPSPKYTATYVYEGGRKLKYLAFAATTDAITLAAKYTTSWTITSTVEGVWSYASVSTKQESGHALASYNKSDQMRSLYRNQPIRFRDDNNRTEVPTYDAAGNITKIVHPDGTTEFFTYNSRQQVAQHIDRLGRVTQRTFDAQGNRLSETTGLVWDAETQQAVPSADAPPATRSWLYNARGQCVADIDANGNRTDYDYHADGLLATVTEPADILGAPRAVTRYEYDAAGRLTRIVPPNAAAWVRYDYDARNRLVTTTYADGTTDRRFFGTGVNANLLVRQIDRNRNETSFTYDVVGRQIGQTAAGPGGTPVVKTRQTAYLPGSVTPVPVRVVEDGALTTYTLDHRHRQVATRRIPRQVTTNGVTTPKVLETRAPIDTVNRRYVTVDPYGRRTWYAFDSDNAVRRIVVELLPNAVAPPSDTAQRNAYLLGLARPTAANPAYTVEDLLHDAAGQVVERIDGRGVRALFAYDVHGRLRSQTVDADGFAGTTLFAYDAVGNRIRVRSPRGIFTRTDFSARNLPLAVIEAEGTAAEAVTATSYTLTRKPSHVTDANGATTAYQHGGCCDRLLGIVDALGFITAFSYDGNGNRTTVIDANGISTVSTYDPLSRVLSRSRQGETTTWDYDADLSDGAGLDTQLPPGLTVALGLGTDAPGSAVRQTNPAGETTWQIADGLGRPVAVLDALGKVTRTDYDAVLSSKLVETVRISPLGLAVRQRADGAGRVRESVDALGKIAKLGFDAAGQQVSLRDANAVGWDATYNGRGWMMSRRDTRPTETNVTTWAYDLDGNRIEETDALGKTEFYHYDDRNRRTTIIDRLGGITQFAYDVVGNLTQISDADNESRGALVHVEGCTQYAYDLRNLLVAEAFPAGQAGRTLRAYAYDAGRRLIQRRVGILSGAFSAAPAFASTPEVTDYAYDGHDRLITRSYAAGSADVFAYDAAGRLRTARSGRYGTEVARDYDLAGRLIEEALCLSPGCTAAGCTQRVGYAYDADDRLVGLTYPTGSQVSRGYTARGELSGVSLNGASVAQRVYDAGGRLTKTTSGNGKVETRSYLTGTYLPAAISIPGVTGFTYAYDAAQRKLSEADSIRTTAQSFGYDDAGRLTSWSEGASTQSWNLSLVGDWNATTRDGVVEPRVNTKVHEATQVGPNILTYDAKGNLTKDEKQTALAWDPENRLTRALVTPDASTTGFGAVATYRYDALGRRVAKTVQNRTTYFVPAGAQTVVEIEQTAMPSQAQVDGAEADGTLANAAQSPASGGILPPTSGPVTRVNLQPQTTVIPAGFLADTGKLNAMRTNGLTYGWSSDATAQAVIRNGAVPLIEFDTHIQLAQDQTWTIALPNGTYPVVVVAGDPLSTQQTNNFTINGQTLTDADPAVNPGYSAGDFDGWAVLVTVTDGTLTIAPAAGALDAKLCFVEIGAVGTAIATETQDRLAALISRVTTETGANPPSTDVVTKEFVYGSYIDEVVAYTQKAGNAVAARYYPHYNHLYSVAALTNAAGQVVERYSYDAYGKQTITSATGVVRAKSSVGWDRGFTGYITDNETGLMYARNRMYSPGLGRFVNRDPKKQKNHMPLSGDGYQDGLSLYNPYFVPNNVDPMGLAPCDGTRPWKCCDTIRYNWDGGTSGDFDTQSACWADCMKGTVSEPFVAAPYAIVTPFLPKWGQAGVAAGFSLGCSMACRPICYGGVEPIEIPKPKSGDALTDKVCSWLFNDCVWGCPAGKKAAYK